MRLYRCIICTLFGRVGGVYVHERWKDVGVLLFFDDPASAEIYGREIGRWGDCERERERGRERERREKIRELKIKKQSPFCTIRELKIKKHSPSCRKRTDGRTDGRMWRRHRRSGGERVGRWQEGGVRSGGVRREQG